MFVYGKVSIISIERENYREVNSDMLQKMIGLNDSRIKDLAMLLGGDYTDGVRGVGVVNGKF